MTDPSESKKATIPQWQQLKISGPSQTSGQQPTDRETPEATSSRAILLEQASTFLEQDGIKDAPTDKKREFLKTKGLTQEESNTLLELPPNKADAKSQRVGVQEEPTAPTVEASEPEVTGPQSAPSKDITPIITYPEFLLHSRKPPPLITANNLINTFYLFSGTAAAIYGTSKYIVDPMLESLTSARHSLFEGAQSNVDTLNEKLGKAVSIIPKDGAKLSEEAREMEDDVSETTEDISPLFNRTVGTQTSPPPSPSTSSAHSPNPPPQDVISTHETSLQSLQASLSSLLPPPGFRGGAKSSSQDIDSQLTDLKDYLDGLAFPALRDEGSKDDAVNKLKADIRGVKGVLLSARNFPIGTGGVG
ncbi:MAG: hypothetical protein LQ348_001738 [Seirophora lacunosa]|nr:MAG: hypothetical protein LQ348_001738 [Seirophora lacunosa]